MNPEFFRKYSNLINEAEQASIDDNWFKQGAFIAAKKSTAREPFRILTRPELIKTLENLFLFYFTTFWFTSREFIATQ